MRLHDLLDYWGREQPDAEFAVHGDRRFTYRDALTTADQLAGALIAGGLGPGDRVAILAANSIEYLIVYFGVSKAGVTLVPMNTRLAAEDWAYILHDAHPSWVFASTPFCAALDDLRPELPGIRRYITLSDPVPAAWEGFKALIADHPGRLRAHDLSDATDAYQMYTSGTTGRPKGAVLGHEAVVANMVQVAAAYAAQAGERSLAALPLFHASVVPTVLAPMLHGASAYVMDAFSPAEVVRVLAEERTAIATLVPSMIQMCLMDAPEAGRRRYDTLRLIHYGASPIAEQTLRSAMAVFGCKFLQSYGMTEATQALTFLSPADHRRGLAERPELLLSAGRPAFGTQIRVVDPDDRPLPAGQAGEIVARGPQVMRGYWNRPEESEETLRGGWLHTGDIGLLDDEGYLFVQDRLKDMIVSGGENVYPRRVEDVLFRHPAIADAAVIGVPDDRWGETVKAVVVLRPGATATADEILAFCTRDLGGFQRPRSVDFADALPRNPSGKVLKRVLREPYWAGHGRRVAGP